MAIFRSFFVLLTHIAGDFCSHYAAILFGCIKFSNLSKLDFRAKNWSKKPIFRIL